MTLASTCMYLHLHTHMWIHIHMNTHMHKSGWCLKKTPQVNLWPIHTRACMHTHMYITLYTHIHTHTLKMIRKQHGELSSITITTLKHGKSQALVELLFCTLKLNNQPILQMES